MHYGDKRGRYKDAMPWDFSSVGRATNTPQPEPKSDLAKRGLAPGDHFREVTSTVAPLEPVASVIDTKVPETVTDAPQPAPIPASIGSVLSEDSVQGSEG